MIIKLALSIITDTTEVKQKSNWVVKIFITFFTLLILLSLPNPAWADSKANLKSCYADPINPTASTPVQFTVVANSAEALINIKIEITNHDTGITRTLNPPNETSSKTQWVFDLGSYSDPGVYKIQFEAGEFRDRTCRLEAAFRVTSGALNFSIDPNSPITTEIKTINSITISGVTAGTTYNIKLHNWDGDNLSQAISDDSRTNDWTSAGNVIEASAICDNGYAGRDGTGDNEKKACGNTFADRNFALSVYVKGGSYVDSFIFQVGALGGGGGGGNGPGEGSMPDKCGPNNEGYETALGCIPATVQGFVNTFLQIAIGIAGGIAFLMMVFGAIRILTSTGDPQALNAGRELIISAVSGLLFIALAVFLLRVIGFDIFQLPIPR